VLWSGWYDYVLPRASGLTPEFADQNLRLAARDFCERSLAVTLRGTATATDSAEDYAMSFADAYEPVKVRRVWYDGRKVREISSEQLSEDNNEDWTTVTGTPARWTHNGAIDRIRLVPRHEGPDKPIAYLAAVMPPITAQGFLDEFAARYYKAIGDGALELVLMIKDRPWSDPNRAMFHKELFDGAVNSAHAKAARGFAGDFLRHNSRSRFL